MLNKIILIASIAWSFCNAANGNTMIGDFSPMKVGNTWVYSVLWESQYIGTPLDSSVSEKIIKIVSMKQNGDSLFYTVVDSTIELYPSYVPVVYTNTFLQLNNINFIYDTSTKTSTPVESMYVETMLYNNNGFPEYNFGLCGYHQLPDSILKKVPFLSQSLYSFSLLVNLPFGGESTAYYTLQWIQNFGLIKFTNIFANEPGTSTETINLVSFNNQMVGKPITAIAPPNISQSLSENQNVLIASTRNQIRWRGLSAVDRLNIQVYDCRGKLVLSSRQLQGSFVLNTSRFSRGAYILRYQVNNETWKHFSFVRN